eukprot:s596_g19.t2
MSCGHAPPHLLRTAFTVGLGANSTWHALDGSASAVSVVSQHSATEWILDVGKDEAGRHRFLSNHRLRGWETAGLRQVLRGCCFVGGPGPASGLQRILEAISVSDQKTCRHEVTAITRRLRGLEAAGLQQVQRGLFLLGEAGARSPEPRDVDGQSLAFSPQCRRAFPGKAPSTRDDNLIGKTLAERRVALGLTTQ